MTQFDPIHIPEAWDEKIAKLEAENQQARASVYLLRRQLNAAQSGKDTADHIAVAVGVACALAGFIIGLSF